MNDAQCITNSKYIFFINIYLFISIDLCNKYNFLNIYATPPPPKNNRPFTKIFINNKRQK